MKILLIEDEPKTLAFVKKGLEENAFNVDTAADGRTGRKLALGNSYDLIISDIILPGLDGRQLCRDIRSAGIATPLLMLTALGGADHVVEGLDNAPQAFIGLLQGANFGKLVIKVAAE